jgi:cytochrome c biogenesis protein ResB
MTSTPATVITRPNRWQALWRVVVSDDWLAGAALGIAVLLGAAAILPQTPQGDSAAYARWLSDAQLRFGGATGILSALGLFDVVHSVVFRALAGVLGLALAVRLADRVQAYRTASRPADPPDPPAHFVDIDRPADTLLGRLRGYRTRQGDKVITADRFPLAYLGPVAAYAGLLIVLIGLTASPLLDWRVADVRALPNAASPVPGTPYTLRVSDIDAQGSVNLSLLQGDTPVFQGTAAPGRPAFGGGISLFVHDLLPALRVNGQDRDGQPLDLQVSAESVPTNQLLLAFDSDRPDAFFVAPKARLAVRVSLEGRIEARAYRVSIFSSPGAGRVAEASLQPDPVERIDAEGSHFEFVNQSHAAISIVSAPSNVLIVAGLIAAIAGLSTTALFPARRVWLISIETGARAMCDDPYFDLTVFTPAGRER